eukprot:s8346_g1.t1
MLDEERWQLRWLPAAASLQIHPDAVRLLLTADMQLMGVLPFGECLFYMPSLVLVAERTAGLISLAIELKRCLPYPVYLVLVYAVQILCCLPSLHSSLSLEIPSHGSATAATISIATRLSAA